MVRRVRKRILSFMKAASDFVMHLLHTPKEESTPDPAKAAAKQVKDAMHVRGVGGQGGGFSGSSATDGLYGKVLAEGHEKARKQS